MLEWLHALKETTLVFWRDDSDVTSGQIAGLVAFCAFVYAFIQELYAATKPAVEYGWSILLALVILTISYYLFGWMFKRLLSRSASILKKLVKLHVVHFFLSMMIITTSHFTEEWFHYPWIDSNWISERSPWAVAIISSFVASVMLLVHTTTKHTIRISTETYIKTYITIISVYLTVISSVLLALWVIPMR